MELSKNDKENLMKVISAFTKELHGKGADNLCLKSVGEELHLHSKGILSNFEKRLIKDFGEEAIECLEHFYKKGMYIMEKHIMDATNDKYRIRFISLDTDFNNNVFILKMKSID